MANRALVCPVCGRTFDAKMNQTRETCSRACAGNMRLRKAIDRWSARVGEPVDAWLRRRYVEEGASFRDLMADMGLNEVRTLSKVMRLLGIEIRRGTVAVRQQWQGAEARRASQSLRVKTNPRFLSELGRYAHGKEPSPREIVIRHWLEGVGVRVVPQYPVQFVSADGRRMAYHLDLFLPELRAAIEVYGGKCRLDPVRHRHVSQLGIRVLYVPNRIADRGERERVEQLVAALKRARLDPAAANDEQLVLWGYPHDAPVEDDGHDGASVTTV